MNHKELENFTYEELSYFTQEELEILPADLMRRILDRNEPLPPSAIIKLNTLIDQANSKTKNSKKQIKEIITKAMDPVNLLKLLADIIIHKSEIANSFISVLDSALKFIHH